MGLFSKKIKKQTELHKELDLNTDKFKYLYSDKNTVGTEYKIYIKELENLQFNLFTKIEMYEFTDGSKNIFLRSDINNTDYDELKTFVNQLIELHGNDFTNSGKLTEDEIDNIAINNFWAGRTWDNIKPIISIDALDDEHFTLSLLGV
ncbi:hypothetical protein [Tenacibaculum finnmarkense]|uniref:hypothetical protein n=1 Tax=Tenacibaculum finnmarkense TaxID=2781243 RepID=UPI001BE6A9C1|nr:hypothetical protein [Tenacibaculum finnmarkense]MCD8450384.1 hypothetical protein [Tenacibaculum dicentrarchi]MCG8751535.1 hypothetical protein [Tenacibaculum finnmarkense]MCG8770608.1 hypothetical protein [Tenacibaculum finnmarkense]MCG8775620.1 hypothetical protein [Tenacibaculum finnmarkense]MCG8860083.1 hypothetical protein [Tenacibaculum finnmarkense]